VRAKARFFAAAETARFETTFPFAVVLVVLALTNVFFRTAGFFDGIAKTGSAATRSTSAAKTIRHLTGKTLKSVFKTKTFLALFRT
jgi:hypothetical protein